MQETKIIQDVQVARSSRWPNYGATVDGRVFRWNTEKEMAICIRTREKDYPTFRACHNNKAVNACVHVIVADCWLFNDDPTNKVDVNHMDGDKRNYHLNNLEWVTKSQNQRHALKNGLKQKGEDLYNAQLTEAQVHLICQKLQQGARPVDLSKEFEVSADIIRKIKDGSTYFHIRAMYPIDHSFKTDFSEFTVRWVCDNIVEGLADKKISELSNNDLLTTIDVKRIRNKIRYRHISDEYF